LILFFWSKSSWYFCPVNYIKKASI
jgi:hypothetical protein